MPIQPMSFPMLDWSQTNPFLQGMEQGQKIGQGFMQFPLDMQAKMLQNQISQAQAKYADPMEQAKLAYQQAMTPNLNAQSSLYTSEAAKNNFMREHPGYLVGGAAGNLEYLKSLGLPINNIFGGGQQGGSKTASQAASQGAPQIASQTSNAPQMSLAQQVLANQQQMGGISPVTLQSLGNSVTGTGRQLSYQPQAGIPTNSQLTPQQAVAAQQILARQQAAASQQTPQQMSGVSPVAQQPLSNLPTGVGMQSAPQPQAGGMNQSFSPNPLLNAMINQMVYGSPINPLQAKQVEAYGENLKQNITYGNQQLTDANKQASDAITMNQYIDRFQDAYKRSLYKGQGVFGSGASPTTGIMAGIRNFGGIGHDWTPETEADQAAYSIQQQMIPLLHTNKLTNYELGFLGNVKLNRTMSEDAVNNISEMLKAFNNRVIEYQPFYNAGIQQGYDPRTLDALWNLYAYQRPVMDQATHQINKEYVGTNSWKDYLNPKAASAIQNGQYWEPPITDADITHTAKVTGMSVDQVRKVLSDQGRL